MNVVHSAMRWCPPGVLEAAKALYDRHLDRRARVGWWAGLERCASAITADSLRGIQRLEDWRDRRPAARRHLAWMLGLDPMPNRTPLAPRTTGTLVREGHRVEKVVFESLPGLWVTANLYLPRNPAGPVPCVLYLCGHQIHPLGAKTQYQDRVLGYPRLGMACLAVDSLLCGEAQGCHRGTHTLGKWDWLSRGFTPAGVEVWNAIRALDYLQERPEIDAQRIGVTGTSGGGVMTWMVAALEERIRVAVPSASTYTVESQVKSRLMPFQCDCTYFPNVFQMDLAEVGALVAPKPVLILAGKRDRIFPPSGYRDMFGKLSGIYGLFPEEDGARSRLQLAECNRGHAETAESIRRTHEWMARWLAPEPMAERDVPASPAPREPSGHLACLAEIPPDLANFSIHRSFVPAHAVQVPDSAESWERRRKTLMGRLDSTVFRWFPRQKAIPYRSRRLPGSGGHARRFAQFGEWEFISETADWIRAQVFEPKTGPADAPLLVAIKRRGESWDFPDDELLPLLSDHRVLVLAARFARWNPDPIEYSAAERAAALCGRTIAALQTWDVVRAVRWALDERALAPRKIGVWGRGEAGVVGLYAGVFEPRIDHVVLQDPPASHRMGPAMLTVLRTTDIPEVAGMMAPREVTIVGEPSQEFSMVRQIFRLAGAERHYRVADHLVAALRGFGAAAGPTFGGRPGPSKE